MPYQLLPVRPEDADDLVRKCLWPAVSNDPLQKFMFPALDKRQEEDCIVWTIRGLFLSISAGEVQFVKICNADGVPRGYAGWTLPDATSGATTQPSTREPYPYGLDTAAWLRASAAMKDERDRVLEGRMSCSKLAAMFVDPTTRRQGVGSILMNEFCRAADAHSDESFVMAAPSAAPFYSRYGFVTAGTVHTADSELSRSMIRRKHKGDASSTLGQV